MVNARRHTTFNTRTGKGLRITRPGKGGGQILPLPAISASIRARITKFGKRKDTPVNFMVCNFGEFGGKYQAEVRHLSHA